MQIGVYRRPTPTKPPRTRLICDGTGAGCSSNITNRLLSGITSKVMYRLCHENRRCGSPGMSPAAAFTLTTLTLLPDTKKSSRLSLDQTPRCPPPVEICVLAPPQLAGLT